MIEGAPTIDRINGIIQSKEGSAYIPLPITVLGPDGPCKPYAYIKWAKTFANVLIVTDASHTPKHYISDFRLTREQVPDGQRWKIVHREVNKKFTIEGTDRSVAEETVHLMRGLVRKLHIMFYFPSRVWIESSRPSLVRFFEKMNFTPAPTAGKEKFDIYMQEFRSRPREDFLHSEPSVGSRFLIVRESSRKDPVLVDKHHYAYDPSMYGVQKRVVHLQKPPVPGPFDKEPYVVRVELSEEL